jgi:hypothetical protein
MDMPVPRIKSGAAVANGLLFVVGGLSWSGFHRYYLDVHPVGLTDPHEARPPPRYGSGTHHREPRRVVALQRVYCDLRQS